MYMDGGYPTMSNSELSRAPWNQPTDDDLEMEAITATKTYSFSYSIPVEIPEGLDDNIELEKYYRNDYSTLEEIFKYLKEKFKNSQNKIERTIKIMAENAIVDDSYIDFC